MSTDERDSLWNATAETPDYPPLAGGASADVVVIGGGIVGITVADLLKRAGRKVVVVEAQRPGQQVTGRSTAKLTALHGMTYSRLVARHGVAIARSYAEANQAAVEYVIQRAAEADIDCALQRLPTFTCSIDPRGLGRIREEFTAAKEAGLPVEFVEEAPLPFGIAGAVRLDNQVAFHPQRYLVGLASQVDGDGSRIFGQTRALSIEEGSPSRVITDRGMVTARDVIVATHLPFLDRGLYFAKAFPRRHTVLAARVSEDKAPGGMFLGIDTPGWSVRPFRDARGSIVVVTGSGTSPGQGDPQAGERRLEEFVSERFGAGEVLHRWSNEDYDSMDGLPFVGRMPTARRIWVATGFSAWGLSGGTAAARLLVELLEGRQTELASQWDARRWNLKVAGREFLAGNLHSGREMIVDRIMGLRVGSVDDIAPGEGGLARHHGRLVAAYRSPQGELTTHSPYCTHLRCVLAWNKVQLVWECPYHGSVFDRKGRMVHGPAVRDLRRLD